MMASPTGEGGESGNGKEQTLEEGTTLLKDFIHERVQRHGDSNTDMTRAQLGEGELSDPDQNWTIGQYLRAINDEMVRNIEIRSFLRERDSWERSLSHIDTPTWQTLGVFLAGVLTIALVTGEM
ncbi:uncharacterized protein LOC144539485 [Centroberyx gerrardi]